MNKIDARKISTSEQQMLRNQAIRLRKAGRKYKEISEITGVHHTTICTWWKAYERGGSGAIRIKKRGRAKGRCRILSIEQEKTVQSMIRDKCPNQLKLPFALWTRNAIKDLINQRFAIDMPVRTIGDYLKRWGYTPQKPLRRAYKQNPKAVKKWLNKEYPSIKKKAKKEKAEIHWGDETGLCNDSYHGRSYAPRGNTPAIKLFPKCKRINLISTVTNQGKVRFMIYDSKMNSDVLIKFMKRLIKDSKRKIFLILDNLPVHHCKAVKEWLIEREKYIEVFYLPSYSPELNPDEYLNCDLKAGVHSTAPARNEKELKSKALLHLRKLQKMSNRVKKYFHHRRIAYAS